MDMDLADENHPLWSSKTSNTSACPSALPFSVRLPTKFKNEDNTFALPPSYELPVNSVSGFIIKCSYSISLIVTRIPNRRLRFFTAHSKICVPFIYTVRTRPWRPVQTSLGDFFSDVVTQVLPRQPPSSVELIYMHLFLPEVEIFGLQDPIPFHIQLTGPIASLREFLSENPCDPQNIQVMLMRQVVLDLYGHRSRGTIVLGRATLVCCPAGHGTSCDYSAEFDSAVSLDWDGEVRCELDVAVGEFDAGLIRVQDFICLELRWPDCSNFASARHTHPIKLVTDSWTGYDGRG
ncbi:hypothetical protein C8J57DRAFT_1338291 [Mycena rebaudengoi]|nr:hypothetical protein C8J57DRAFT_1338291 [Mycena rebaudengoi]